MSDYYQFQSLDMVMPDQVDGIRKSQDGVVGWRYRPDKRILDLLFETDVKAEEERLQTIALGQTVYLVLDSQRKLFHLPTREGLLEEIAGAADDLVSNACSADEGSFNPAGYLVDADDLTKLSLLLEKLSLIEEQK